MWILEATLEDGSSYWLTTLPIKEHGFYLGKQAFWDTLYLRYNIQLRNLPSHCVCGKTFSIDHALSCPKGGFISLRHNKLRDFTAKVLAECHTNVKIEPALTPLTGETFPQASTVTTDEACVDIAARGVWVKGQMAVIAKKSSWPQTFLLHIEGMNWKRRECMEGEFEWSTRRHSHR